MLISVFWFRPGYCLVLCMEPYPRREVAHAF